MDEDLTCHSAADDETIRPRGWDETGHGRFSRPANFRFESAMNQILRRAMQDSDHYVVEMDYADAKGNRTHRVVSPIRFLGTDRFLGLCLCREEPRQFYLSRCGDLRLVPSASVMMPLPMANPG